MKIAHIVLKGLQTGGGIEKFTQKLSSMLVDRGHEVLLYTMRSYGTIDGIYNGVRVITVPTMHTRNLEKLVASLVATLKQMSTKHVDIVHYHAFGPAVFSIIPRLFGCKVVVQGHGLEWQRSRWGIGGRLCLKLLEVPSVKFPHVVTVPSLVQKEYLLKKYTLESVHIPYGIDLPQIREPHLIKQYGLYGNDYILFAARLVREKGAHYLLEAYKQLKTPLKLVIAGDAAYEESYKSELHDLARGNANIIFTNFVTGNLLQELFANCYLFVLPSEIEGLSIALLEAMSYGNCCLVSNIPENLEAIQHCGFSFENKDVSNLAKNLAFLASNPAAVNAMKTEARIYMAENYSWHKCTSQFEQLYGNLM